MFTFRDSYIISADVGDPLKGALNKRQDVLTIRSLLNAYARKKKLLLLSSKNTGVVVDSLYIERIKHFQKVEMGSSAPDGVVTKGAGTWRKLYMSLFNNYTIVSVTPPSPKNGQITFNAEGKDIREWAHHSRSLHLPGKFQETVSGLTLGRGYDMKHRKPAEIINDLSAAGVNPLMAKRISLGAGLSGMPVRRFVIDHDLLDFEISAAVQLKLFEAVYKEYISLTKKRATSKGSETNYGKVDWLNLNIGMKTVLIDLRYRGDYTDTTKKFLQVHVVNNDLVGFKKVISDRSNWKNLIKQAPARFKARVDYLATVPAQVTKKP